MSGSPQMGSATGADHRVHAALPLGLSMAEGYHTLCPCVCGRLTSLHSPDHVPCWFPMAGRWLLTAVTGKTVVKRPGALLCSWVEVAPPGIAGHQRWGALSSLLPSLGVILGTRMPVLTWSGWRPGGHSAPCRAPQTHRSDMALKPQWGTESPRVAAGGDSPSFP